MITVQRYSRLSLIIMSIYFLFGCAHLSQPTSLTVKSDDKAQPIAVVALTTSSSATTPAQIALLESRILNLEAKIEKLQNEINDLNYKQTSFTQLFNLETIGKSAKFTDADTKKEDKIIRARRLYNAGLYTQVIKLLKKADHSSNDAATDQIQMWLLIQSHAHLNNCESVINIGQRFTNQFPHHPQAAQTLYLMAQCQQRMQQNDIARTTYLRIIHNYPHSNFAIKAQKKLK